MIATLPQQLRCDIWTVGIVNAPIQSFVSGPVPHVQWLPEIGPDHYYADPFPHPGEADTLLVEEFSYLTGRGRLTAVRTSGVPAPALARGLETQTHAAYPFTLQHGHERYCIPDTGHAREVVLYRWSSQEWERVKTLLTGIDAVDSTVFHDGEQWWLLCGEVGTPARLDAYFADDLLGEWRPHTLNPVKLDAASSRPAGTPFFTDGAWHRPAQDCSRIYGGAVAINRIEVLTPTDFRESTVNVLRPDPNSRYAYGLHTLAAWGDRTIIDGKRIGLRSPRHLTKALLRRFAKR